LILELVCTNMESISAAIEGKADRIELCENLHEGGVTPSEEFILEAKKVCQIPIHVLIRPRSGNFVYTLNEFLQMEEEIRFCKRNGIEGVVLGCLLPSGKIDIENTRMLASLAKPMSVTFHRAFDVASDYPEILEDVIACGCNRLLTSGQAKGAFEGANKIRELITQSAGRIIILPGGRVRDSNVAELIRLTRASEIHSSCINFENSVNLTPDPLDILKLKKNASEALENN